MEQREIKFRYRYTDGTNWIMQVFTLEQIINGDPFEVLSDSPLLKEYKMVGRDEWSGFLDMAGNEIYEHDIMCHPEFSQVDDFPVVLFRSGCFELGGWDCVRTNITKGEVIGNIHEHSVLKKRTTAH